ncbi:MAG TPA: hypothetical protein VF225_02705 [Gaiellaceae bacterium]
MTLSRRWPRCVGGGVDVHVRRARRRGRALQPELGARARQRDRGAAIGQPDQRARDELRLLQRQPRHLQTQPA